MKKKTFFLAALLLIAVLVFASCGNKDNDGNQTADNGQNSVEQDMENGAEDIKNGVEDMGDGIKDGVMDAADDVKDAVDGDYTANNNRETAREGDVSRNTADNGTRSNVQ